MESRLSGRRPSSNNLKEQHKEKRPNGRRLGDHIKEQPLSNIKVTDV